MLYDHAPSVALPWLHALEHPLGRGELPPRLAEPRNKGGEGVSDLTTGGRVDVTAHRVGEGKSREALRRAVAIGIHRELLALLGVCALLGLRQVCWFGSEWTGVVDVDVVAEPVALEVFGEPVPLVGEADTGDRASADQVQHVSGRVGDRERGLVVDVTLMPML